MKSMVGGRGGDGGSGDDIGLGGEEEKFQLRCTNILDENVSVCCLLCQLY